MSSYYFESQDHYRIHFAFRMFDINIPVANKRFKQTLLRAARRSRAHSPLPVDRINFEHNLSFPLSDFTRQQCPALGVWSKRLYDVSGSNLFSRYCRFDRRQNYILSQYIIECCDKITSYMAQVTGQTSHRRQQVVATCLSCTDQLKIANILRDSDSYILIGRNRYNGSTCRKQI